MKSSVLRFVFAAVFAIGLSLHAIAQTPAPATIGPSKPGAIKVGKVQGQVTRLTADSKTFELKVGDTLIETDLIQTGQSAMVVIVFANGASIKLGSNTSMQIAEFKMDPLPKAIEVATLKEEPTISRTRLKLNRGELVGDVKHLNRDKGSSFEIATPVGAAGIRGTQFRIVFIPSGNGTSFTFQLQTADGHVTFYSGQAQATGPELNVLTANEIVVTADATVDPTTGAITVTNVQVPDAPASMSTTATAAITQQVTEVIVEATKNTTITISEQQQASTTPTDTGTPGGGTTGGGTTGGTTGDSGTTQSGTTDTSGTGGTGGTGGGGSGNLGVTPGNQKLTNGAGG